MYMKIKEVKPISFLYFRTETNISELQNFFHVAKELFREAVKHNLTITGPVHWHYFGFNGDFEKPFTLEISLPVGEVLAEYDGKFHFKRTESFKCVVLTHEGEWREMGKSYGQAMEFIAKNQLVPIAVNREIYINADFAFPEANTTEIQIGIR
jgi:effector-binding domain-containing protein